MIKNLIINFLFRRILNAVVVNDVLKTVKGQIYLGNEIITEQEIRQLVQEAKALEGFRLWHIINETLKQEALDRGWNKSMSFDDLMTGKTIFYTLDMQNSIVKVIRSKEKK